MIRSDNRYNGIRAITVNSDNGSYVSRAITIKAMIFLYGVEALCDNAKK
jgi:hypothetical protein